MSKKSSAILACVVLIFSICVLYRVSHLNRVASLVEPHSTVVQPVQPTQPIKTPVTVPVTKPVPKPISVLTPIATATATSTTTEGIPPVVTQPSATVQPSVTVPPPVVPVVIPTTAQLDAQYQEQNPFVDIIDGQVHTKGCSLYLNDPSLENNVEYDFRLQWAECQPGVNAYLSAQQAWVTGQLEQYGIYPTI